MRVNCIAPGVVFSASAKANYDFDILGGSIPGIPAKRLGLTQEVVQLGKTDLEWKKILLTCFFRSLLRCASYSHLEQVSSGIRLSKF